MHSAVQCNTVQRIIALRVVRSDIVYSAVQGTVQ
jgi:hypothetical protein